MAFGSKAVYLTPAATNGIKKGMNGASATAREERGVGGAAEICGRRDENGVRYQCATSTELICL